MYTKVLTIIALIFTKHAKGQDASSCEFPCELRGQTFDVFIGNVLRGNWMFNDNGTTSSFTFDSTTDVLTCYQRVERFIIFRINNEDKFICYIFDYNPGMQPILFSFGFGAMISSNMPVVCNLCNPNGGFTPYLAIATDTASLPCGMPSECPGTNQCSVNDTLPEGCPQSTTTIATTATVETTQPTKPCH
ncbi:FOXG [Mytilus coruscus]|uniref:FOXG n=1 Tax=Mytilus coruscus TaxID=42192 RepID=A0A6J8A3W7_MYTCO|nr:FOXG [Mytilus coruscus]